MSARPCLGIGQRRCLAIVRPPALRCPACQRGHDRARGTTAERGYGAAWQAHSRRV